MFPIAGQTAGPIRLTFFGDTQRWPGGCLRINNLNFFFLQNFFFLRATPGPSACLTKDNLDKCLIEQGDPEIHPKK